MASKLQILRSFTAAANASPAETGVLEGELAVNMAGTGTPALFVFGGTTATGTPPSNKGWLRLNPAPSISVVSKTIAGTGADPAVDGNAAAAAAGQWPWVVNAGEVPIVTHNGTAYAFTGGPGNYGGAAAGATTPLTPGMFTSLGAAPAAPQVVDLTAQNASADIGAAWTANGATASSSVVLARWNGTVYILTNTTAPGTAGSWRPISVAPTTEVIDWSVAPMDAAANIGAAYTAWNTGAGTPDFAAAISIVLWKGRYYLLTDPANPGAAASYSAISPVMPAALTYKGNVDVQAAYAAPATAWNVGDFGMVANTAGDAVGTAVTPGAGWPLVGATGAVEVGDLLLWDGTNYHVMPMDTSLAAYLPLAGGTLTDGAAITFTTTTAAGTPGGARSLTIINGGGGTISEVVIDAGQY